MKMMIKSQLVAYLRMILFYSKIYVLRTLYEHVHLMILQVILWTRHRRQGISQMALEALIPSKTMKVSLQPVPTVQTSQCQIMNQKRRGYLKIQIESMLEIGDRMERLQRRRYCRSLGTQHSPHLPLTIYNHRVVLVRVNRNLNWTECTIATLMLVRPYRRNHLSLNQHCLVQ